MPNGHFGLAGPYTQDPTTANQRWHAERKAREERDDRATRWIAGKLVGKTYYSADALLSAACAITAIHYGRPLTPDEYDLAKRACRVLWSGLVFRAVVEPTRVIVHEDPASVTFLAA